VFLAKELRADITLMDEWKGRSEVDPISWTKKRPFLDGAAG
jgi:hypothetical protein